jgi:hypothetical protein
LFLYTFLTNTLYKPIQPSVYQIMYSSMKRLLSIVAKAGEIDMADFIITEHLKIELKPI